MELLKDYPAFVLVGNWNHGIFKKEWISKFLLPHKELSVEFPLNDRASQRVSSNELRIYTMGDKLFFSPLKSDEQTLDLIEELAVKTADLLPHTPVQAFGVNFKYREIGNKELAEFLQTSDMPRISDDYAELKSSTIRHSFTYDGKLINIDILIRKEGVEFNINFHFDIKSMVEFKEKINENRLLELKNFSLELMRNLYNLN